MTESFGSFIVTPQVVEPSSVTNMIFNPSMETDMIGWTEFGFGLTRVTSGGFSGPSYVKASVPFDDGGCDIRSNVLLNILAGRTVNVSAYVRTGAGTPSAVVQADVGGSLLASSPVTLTTSWQRINVVSAPAIDQGGGFEPLYVHVIIPGAGSLSGQEIWVDAVQLTYGDTLFDYFDGDTAADALYVYAWNGTPHASISTRNLL